MSKRTASRSNGKERFDGTANRSVSAIRPRSDHGVPLGISIIDPFQVEYPSFPAEDEERCIHIIASEIRGRTGIFPTDIAEKHDMDIHLVYACLKRMLNDDAIEVIDQ
jgi:hypothetical protein